ncbi:MAG: ATP-binding cassette domain-containing protein [Spirochaetales bacterium]|nr:ATP-binding cassette domain-containing protein [Spirochaetales bacterium]
MNRKFELMKNLNIVKKSKHFFFLLAIASILVNVFSLVIPIFFLQVYDRIIPYRSESTLIILTIGALVIVVVEMFVMTIRGIIASKFSYSYIHTAEDMLMSKLLSVRNFKQLNFNITEYQQSFRHLQKLGKFYSGEMFQSIMDLPFMLFYLYAIYFFGGKIVIFPISIIVTYFIAALVYKRIFMRNKVNFLETKKLKLSFINEIFSKIHFIKAQSCEDMLIRKFENKEKDNAVNSFKLALSSNSSILLGEMTSQIMLYGTIITGGYLVLNGDISLGVITACTMLSRRAISPLIGISKFMINLSDAEIAIKDLNEKFSFDDITDNKISIPFGIDSVIQIQNLSIKENNRYIVKNLSINIDKDSITAISSNSSLEKSRFFDTLCGIEEPDEGNIYLDNYKINHILIDKFSTGVEFLPKKGKVFKGTIIENITMFNPELSIQAEDTASLVKLDRLTVHLPKGLETELNEKSNETLPSNLINRIILARVFLHRPRVLICDNADEDMDEQTIDIFIELLKEIKINTVIIISTENKKILKICDKHFSIQNNTLVEREMEYYER